MPITWEEIKSHIDFQSVYLNSYLYLEPGDADNLIFPDRDFSATEKDKILESLHQLFDNSPTAKAELSNYFTPNILGITKDLNIYPNKAGEGTWAKTDNIFLDFNHLLSDPPPGSYLTLSGTISSYHLGTIVYHEFLHAYDYAKGQPAPLVELEGSSDYTNPNFDHLGSVVSRTNVVMNEVGEEPRGSYVGMSLLRRHSNQRLYSQLGRENS